MSANHFDDVSSLQPAVDPEHHEERYSPDLLLVEEEEG